MRATAAANLATVALLVAATAVGCGTIGPTPVPPASVAPSASATTVPSSTPPAAPVTDLVTLGNLPGGAALTADGRYLWTVSAGFGANDIRIVDTATRQVCQTIPVAGASGGIALDSAHRMAYVSGLTVSRWRPSEKSLPGARGNVILAIRWTDTCGEAAVERVIEVPPPVDAPIVQEFPPLPADSDRPGARNAWPQQVAVSPDGRRLLVALNLADHAAVVDLADGGDRVRYVPMATASYSFGAAITPDGRTGLVTNEATGLLSVIDLETAELETDIAVGPPLSHPQAVVIDAEGERAYVALSASDVVVVVDLATKTVERTISVGRPAGLGTQPVALALDEEGARLFVVESGADEIAVIHLPNTGVVASEQDWQVIGRIPTADGPRAVTAIAAHDGRPAELAWVSGRGLDVGPNPNGPNPADASDPIFWAFNRVAPADDVFSGSVTYLPALSRGQAGFLVLPSDATLAVLTVLADGGVDPATVPAAPAGSPLRADGPIKHVFFIVRENRSYDQLLGDLGRGNGDPTLSVFPAAVTPNMHALATRFPLLDNVLANSEASIEGHYWTAAGVVPDYVNRNWVQDYSGRGRPNDFGMYAISWPGNGFLFDQAERQGITYFNYGEGFDGGDESVPDKNRSEEALAALEKISANSDLGPALTPGGCYPSDLTIATAVDKGAIFDSSLPVGAPAGSYSHVDCFRARFTAQLTADAVPALNYITLTSDHTRGTEPGYPTPSAMVADSDRALGELVDMISHSAVWASSAIFVVEDDSQDGADHVDAHRIPVLVISPYAKAGAVISTRYDLLSFVRSVELIIGMEPLSLNDALAVPLYDAFSATPDNAAPYDGTAATIDLLEYNLPGAPWASESQDLMLGNTDEASQVALDAIIWRSVFGAAAVPPPPGPNAESAGTGERAPATEDDD